MTASSPRRVWLLISLIIAVLLFMNRGWVFSEAQEDNLSLKAVIGPDQNRVSVEPFVLGLDNPWGMAFLPNGDVLLTEKKGEIRVVRDGKLLEQRIEGLPEIRVAGQGGLLDIELHPQFEQNSRLYLSYSDPAGDGSGSNTSVMRARLVGLKLVEQKVIYRATPNTRAGAHFGSRIEFDRHGYLYFSIGDRGMRDSNPQNLDRDAGKIYRLHDDGRIPEDNPFLRRRGSKMAVFSYGHRNPQGMALNPATGSIWSHEHGPKGGDEINIIKAGRNYGWPSISYGVNYSGTKFTEETARDGMEQPVSYWTPSIAPCGMTFIRGDRYSGWKGDLLVGSLKFNHLVLVDVEGDQVLGQEKVATDIGRVRNVKQGPDGLIYVAIQGEGIFRLIPKS